MSTRVSLESQTRNPNVPAPLIAEVDLIVPYSGARAALGHVVDDGGVGARARDGGEGRTAVLGAALEAPTPPLQLVRALDLGDFGPARERGLVR